MNRTKTKKVPPSLWLTNVSEQLHGIQQEFLKQHLMLITNKPKHNSNSRIYRFLSTSHEIIAVEKQTLITHEKCKVMTKCVHVFTVIPPLWLLPPTPNLLTTWGFLPGSKRPTKYMHLSTMCCWLKRQQSKHIKFDVDVVLNPCFFKEKNPNWATWKRTTRPQATKRAVVSCLKPDFIEKSINLNINSLLEKVNIE